MKKIIYTKADGGIAVVHPFEGARLALSVTLAGGHVLHSAEAMQADRFARRWPVEGATAQWAESEDAFLARVVAKSVPKDGANILFVDESDIPQDRTFRDAWTHDGRGITHDMDKCREIHKDRLRQLRAPQLAALDVEYQRADERQDIAAKQRISAQKQALRDVTKDPRIASAVGPSDLVVPEVLI